MASVSRYGRDVTTVFDLLGRHEPALTAALGWTMARSPKLLGALLTKLALNGSTDAHNVAVQLESADALGRTDIEIFTPTAHVIIEAKQGWIVPGEMQLSAYVPRLKNAAAGGPDTRLVTLSDSTPEWAREVLPPEVGGVPVVHWSWDDVREHIEDTRRGARGIERLWLDQMEDYMGAATSPVAMAKYGPGEAALAMLLQLAPYVQTAVIALPLAMSETFAASFSPDEMTPPLWRPRPATGANLPRRQRERRRSLRGTALRSSASRASGRAAKQAVHH